MRRWSSRPCLVLWAAWHCSTTSLEGCSSPRAAVLFSSLSRSLLSTSRYCISKRSSRACLSSSSSANTAASSPPTSSCALPACSRWRVFMPSRCSRMKVNRSLRGSFPAVWLSTKFVACWSHLEAGTLTPSTVCSLTSRANVGGRTCTGPLPFFFLSFSTVAAIRSCRACAASTSSSACALWRISSRRRSGAQEPTTDTTTGSKSNCDRLKRSSTREVLCLVGAKVTTTSAAPSAGIAPRSGETSKSGWSSKTVISYSNWIGILQDSGIVRVFLVPMATRPKSMIRGSERSFTDGYAWMGTTRFSARSPQKTLTVS
mmetsp:Transcript_85101/g.260025  ORF Transcript_85101/g.260025 Transcript_85101/m.260025 type:complete len:316 (-) Transcript_85101:414-1361(-)